MCTMVKDLISVNNKLSTRIDIPQKKFYEYATYLATIKFSIGKNLCGLLKNCFFNVFKNCNFPIIKDP